MAQKGGFRRYFLLSTLLTIGVSLSLIFLAPVVTGQTQTGTTTGSTDSGIALMGAGLAIAGSCIGAGYAVGKAASSAASAIVEKPSTFGPMLIFAGLGEGIAIYGLLVAFQILSKV